MTTQNEPVAAAQIINLCPHDMNLIIGDRTVVIRPSGLARCVEQRETLGCATSDGVVIPLFRCHYGQVTGLPDPVPGTIYVVSHLVAERCPDREDLVVPDQLVRDDDGVIVGAQALAVI